MNLFWKYSLCIKWTTFPPFQTVSGNTTHQSIHLVTQIYRFDWLEQNDKNPFSSYYIAAASLTPVSPHPHSHKMSSDIGHLTSEEFIKEVYSVRLGNYTNCRSFT